MAARRCANGAVRTFLALVLASAAMPATAQNVSVQAAVERAEVYVGEPFRFRIAVSGSDQVAAPEPRTGRRLRGASSGRRTEQQRDRHHHQRHHHTPGEPGLCAQLRAHRRRCRRAHHPGAHLAGGGAVTGHQANPHSGTRPAADRGLPPAARTGPGAGVGRRAGAAHHYLAVERRVGAGTGCRASATRCWTAPRNGVSATSIGHPAGNRNDPVRLAGGGPGRPVAAGPDADRRGAFRVAELRYDAAFRSSRGSST